jgi:Asp-tRNA(Asn)/Glu-tRNA(Gln) amidotransferase C subunit
MAQVLSGEALAENPSLRDDALASGDVIDAVLDIAPNPSRPYFRVPRVIER